MQNLSIADLVTFFFFAVENIFSSNQNTARGIDHFVVVRNADDVIG